MQSMRVLRWVILILALLALPRVILRTIWIYNHGTEVECSAWAVEVGFGVFFVALGLKMLGRGRRSDSKEQ
jgi:hypothetical protein